MNEPETRAELIDPKLTASGWGIVPNTKVLREFIITAGKIQTGGGRSKQLIADYVLVYQGVKLAVIEAKSDELPVGAGVAQAKNYAGLLGLDTTYATNGREIYGIDMKTGWEGPVTHFPTPDQLWNKTFDTPNHWRDQFNALPFEYVGGTKGVRYYQERAVNSVMTAIANNEPRILLTLATGTGKTFIAFQIAWKLFKTRWNLARDGRRQPRILFLADRNILADQAFNAFQAFPDDALVRISPAEIRRRGSVPTNGSIFFTIFQTFMSGTDAAADGAPSRPAPYFGAYPPDYFDFIIIDECHRGGANDESTWRDILTYFAPAVQLGLTATPKRDVNADTYRYFGEPVYIYSLKEGINDGFLTPFKVKRIQTTLDDYIYTSDDIVVEGEVEAGRVYRESDFNRTIEITERETKRVQLYLTEADQREKAIVFCATQDHALVIRDLINQLKTSRNPNYCQRVTADDGALGEQYLRDFQDNEKTIPAILTTSQKLSTGVDARNIRNIVLLRPVNSMVEFKQIIGRGTRLFEGKEFFTIYDYVGAYEHFIDPEWDGPPEEPDPKPEPKPYPAPPTSPGPSEPPGGGDGYKPRLKIKLRDGKEREIQHMMATSFWSADGRIISAEEFLHNLYGTLPDFFQSEDELRAIWSNPLTRKTLLTNLADAGYGNDELSSLQRLVQAENSDLFDVLEYISFARKPISRADRVAGAETTIFALLSPRQKEFLEFVLDKYVESGVSELDQEKLPTLLELKYQSIQDAAGQLGGVSAIRTMFIDFQKHLYQEQAA